MIKLVHSLLVVGPSGSGKTSFLRQLCQLSHPDLDLGGFRPPLVASLAVAFQEPRLLADQTVLRNLQLVEHQDDPPRLAQVLELTELTEGIQASLPHQLSSGEQQRVNLARALYRKSSVILLDEPLANLDQCLVRRLLPRLLHWLAQSKQQVVWIDHDLRVNQYFAQLLVFNQCRLIYSGPPAQAWTNPDLTLAQFLGPFTLLHRDLVKLGAEPVTSDADYFMVRPSWVTFSPSPRSSPRPTACVILHVVPHFDHVQLDLEVVSSASAGASAGPRFSLLSSCPPFLFVPGAVYDLSFVQLVPSPILEPNSDPTLYRIYG